jgi:hypothetical protein
VVLLDLAPIRTATVQHGSYMIVARQDFLRLAKTAAAVMSAGVVDGPKTIQQLARQGVHKWMVESLEGASERCPLCLSWVYGASLLDSLQ